MGTALIFLSCFGIALRLIAPGIALEDSGEFVTAAVTLSITHPPGYPLYVLLGKLFSLIPVGSPGFRLSLFSAACASGTAAALYRFSTLLLGPGSVVASATGALVLFLTPALALQSALPDKYAFSTVLICLLYILTFTAWREGPRRLPALAFLVGATFSHHMMTLYLAPAILGLLWRDRRLLTLRTAVVLVMLSALGLTLKPLALVLLSVSSISLMYSPLNSAGKLAGYLAATAYSGRFVAFEFTEKITRIWTHGIMTLWSQLGGFMLAFTLLGAVLAWKRWRPFLLAGLAGTGIAVILVANFQIAGVDYYLLPSTAVACILAAAGLDWLRPRITNVGVAFMGLGMLAIAAVASLPRADLSNYYGASDWARNILSSQDRDCVMLSIHDDDFFPPLYFTRVLEERPDVVIVHRPMITRLWYHTQVEALHPGFKTLAPDIIPWGTTIQPDMLINIFLRSHYGKGEVAFTYIPNAETAGGYKATPDFAMFRLGRKEDRIRPPRADQFARQVSRMRLRYLFTDYGPKSFRFREVAGAIPSSWVQLAALWYEAGDMEEARRCMRMALSYPYTRVVKDDIEKMRLALGV